MLEAGKVVSFGSSIVKSDRSSVVNNMKSLKVSQTFDEFLGVRVTSWR